MKTAVHVSKRVHEFLICKLRDLNTIETKEYQCVLI